MTRYSAPAATWWQPPPARPGLPTTTLPAHAQHPQLHPARAIVPPPRLRAKPVAFSSPLHRAAGRAGAGGSGAAAGARNSSDPLTGTPFPRRALRGPRAPMPGPFTVRPPCPVGAGGPGRACAPCTRPNPTLHAEFAPCASAQVAAGWPVKERCAGARCCAGSVSLGAQRLEGARLQDGDSLAGGLDPLARAVRHEVARHHLTWGLSDAYAAECTAVRALLYSRRLVPQHIKNCRTL
jgi:hypothetical protein